MSEGRVFRRVKTTNGWEPIGEVLPAWDHVPPRPNQPINVWVLPRGEGYAPGDVLFFGETGHRLLSPVPPDDVAWHDVIEAASLRFSHHEVRNWISQIELWLGLRVDGVAVD